MAAVMGGIARSPAAKWISCLTHEQGASGKRRGRINGRTSAWSRSSTSHGLILTIGQSGLRLPVALGAMRTLGLVLKELSKEHRKGVAWLDPRNWVL